MTAVPQLKTTLEHALRSKVFAALVCAFLVKSAAGWTASDESHEAIHSTQHGFQGIFVKMKAKAYIKNKPTQSSIV